MALLNRFSSRIKKSPFLQRFSVKKTSPTVRRPVVKVKPAPRPLTVIKRPMPAAAPAYLPVVKPAVQPVIRPTVRPAILTIRNSGIVPPSVPKGIDPRAIRTLKPAVVTPRNSGIVPPSLPKPFKPLKPLNPAVIRPAVIKPALKPVIKTAVIDPTDPWNCGENCNTKPVQSEPVKTSTPGPIEPKESTIDPAETLLEAQEKGISPDLLKPQNSTKTAGGSGIFLGLMALVGGGYFLFGGKEKSPSKKASLNGPSDASKSTKHLKMNL
jgi:hypothetical protein